VNTFETTQEILIPVNAKGGFNNVSRGGRTGKKDAMSAMTGKKEGPAIEQILQDQTRKLVFSEEGKARFVPGRSGWG